MHIFDMNCMLGPTRTDREPCFRTSGALLAEMDRLGISEALVHASHAEMGHPADANARVVEATRSHPRLHPCWAVLPPGTGELPEPRELVAQMRAQGVRAARIFPGVHVFPLLERILRPLLKALAEAGIPLILDQGRTSWSQLTDWRAVFEIAEAHPTLPLVLIREGGATARALFGVWDAFPNIYIEASYVQESRIVEEITGRFGHRRLLFGTGMPAWDPGGPLGLLEGARISEHQRADIAGNTLRRLLGLPARGAGAARSWPCGAGGFRVFDAHGHLGRFHSKYHRDWSAEQMVSRMDEVGVERFAVSHFLAIGADYREGNTRIGRGVAAFPDRLVGYAVYNPNYESEMADEMARGFDQLGCSGIKLHCTLHDTSTEDPRYRLAFQTAHDRNCPMLCHVNRGPSPAFLMDTLAAFPNAKFIYAHIGGGTREELKPFLDVAHERPNLFFDLGYSKMARGALAWLVEHAPPAQILYGSDHPVNGFPYQLGRVLYADVPDVLKRMILWDNAARIFGVQ